MSSWGQKATSSDLVKNACLRGLSGRLMSAFTVDGDFVPRLPAHPLRADARISPSFGRLVATIGLRHTGRIQFLRAAMKEPGVLKLGGLRAYRCSQCHESLSGLRNEGTHQFARRLITGEARRLPVLMRGIIFASCIH
jgi:hypothetical protein